MFQDKTEDNRSAVGEYEKTMARKKIDAHKPMKNWFSTRGLKRASWDELLEARAIKCTVLRESVKPGCRRSKRLYLWSSSGRKSATGEEMLRSCRIHAHSCGGSAKGPIWGRENMNRERVKRF